MVICSSHTFLLSLSFSLQGMVEPGDTVSATLKKEFGEEAMNSLEASEAEKKEIEGHINTLFCQGDEVNCPPISDTCSVV